MSIPVHVRLVTELHRHSWRFLVPDDRGAPGHQAPSEQKIAKGQDLHATLDMADPEIVLGDTEWPSLPRWTIVGETSLTRIPLGCQIDAFLTVLDGLIRSII